MGLTMNWDRMQQNCTPQKKKKSGKPSKFYTTMQLRKEQLTTKPTKAELKLWKHLQPHKFQFQRAIVLKRGKSNRYYYILDFYHPSTKIAVEIDGGYHNSEIQKTKDEARDTNLFSQREITVIRYSNKEVFQETNRVLDEIISMVKVRLGSIRCENETRMAVCHKTPPPDEEADTSSEASSSYH